MKPSAKSLSVLIAFLLALISLPARAQRARGQQKAMDTAISVDFSECTNRRRPISSPGAFHVNPDDLAKLLNGVWVGTRTLREGKVPMANYAMIIDSQAREVLIYEERGEEIKENAFASKYGAPAPNAPRLTYFYCGSPGLYAFKDEFVKVSDQPQFDRLADTIRVSVSRPSLSKIWETLKETGAFTKSRGSTELNTAFYAMAVTSGKTGGRFQDVRLDFAGQLRGSPNKSPEYAKGRAVPGIESGLFRSVMASSGGYLLSTGPVAVPCFGGALTKIEEDAPPLTNFSYTKVVLGPLGNQLVNQPVPQTTTKTARNK